MTINDLLDALDGCGIVYEDDRLVRNTLLSWGWKNGLMTELVRVKNEEKESKIKDIKNETRN